MSGSLQWSVVSSWLVACPIFAFLRSIKPRRSAPAKTVTLPRAKLKGELAIHFFENFRASQLKTASCSAWPARLICESNQNVGHGTAKNFFDRESWIKINQVHLNLFVKSPCLKISSNLFIPRAKNFPPVCS